VDEKRVIDKLRVSRTPFREAIGILAKGGLVEIKPYRGFYVRSFSRSETADLYELFKRLECFAVELSVPQMSDRDIRRFEDMLIEAGAALQRGDAKTYAMRENFTRISPSNPKIPRSSRRWRGLRCKSSSAAQWQAWARSLPSAPRTVATTSYKHSRPAILRAPLFSFAAASAIPRTQSLRAFPMRQRLAKAGITSRLSESCHRMTLTSPGSGNSAER
jgi:hypothetical protein